MNYRARVIAVFIRLGLGLYLPSPISVARAEELKPPEQESVESLAEEVDDPTTT
jgi:hypothetical protein